MAKKHGAKQQKRLAKQKARRQAKRSILARRTSRDPTIRLQHAENWPVVQALVSTELWDEGIGYLVLAREDPEGAIVFASFLVDVLCLGVKAAFWKATSMEEFREIVREMERVQALSPIDPACLVEIVEGAVEFAQSFGFPPHPDYRHASLLLAGIDRSNCPERYIFGEDGKPHYVQGPNESPAQARAIAERVHEVGGYYTVVGSAAEVAHLADLEDDSDEDEYEEDDDTDSPRWTWRDPGPGGRR